MAYPFFSAHPLDGGFVFLVNTKDTPLASSAHPQHLTISHIAMHSHFTQRYSLDDQLFFNEPKDADHRIGFG
jgi:hypothetical protein